MMNIYTIFQRLTEKIKLYRTGYLPDQQGIMNRYYNEQESWNAHLSKSKDFILKSAKDKNKGKVVVLGSGWLLDLPLDELSSQFEEVVLIDINHPKPVLHKIKKYSNVYAVNADITGGLIELFYSNRKKLKKENSLILPINQYQFHLPNDADFVISLNILCQLHIILIDYLKKIIASDSIDYSLLEKQIQESHLNILPKNKTCIITDIEEEIISPEDVLIGVNPLLHIKLPEGNFSEQWQWKFDNRMTYRDDAKTYFNTKAIDF